MEQMLQPDPRFEGKTVTLQNFIRPEDGKEAEKGEYVLYFGRLSEEKGIDRLLKACRLLPEIPFVVAGRGPLEHLLETPPPNVRYVGFQEGETLRELIRRAQFSVYLPVWYENCPLSVLESQSLGTPVLANAIGGIPELIQDGGTGRLLEQFTPEACAAGIRELYGDREALARMSEKCRNRENYLTIEDYCGVLLELYRQAAKG